MSTDFPGKIDLTECEREPICHLGLIQPHGALLAANSDAIITHASANVEQYIGIAPANALGRPLDQVLGAISARTVVESFASIREGQFHHEFWEGFASSYSLWTHRRDSRFILEWEPPHSSESEWKGFVEQVLPQGLLEIRGARDIHRQAQLAAELVARLTGFDRVMIYRFHPDLSGEVIAEVRQPWAEPYLGLFYPASDIPPQARQLYLINLLRVLVDVHASAVDILSLAGESQALDLTLSRLRALSPYHIQYLKNMNVGATATASLICHEKAGEERLWGLIACHHDRRKAVSQWQRDAISEIALALGGSIEQSIQRARQFSEERLKQRENALQTHAGSSAAALCAVVFGPERLRNLVKSCGIAVWTAHSRLRMGECPSAEELDAYVASLVNGDEDILSLNSRTELISRLGLAPLHSAQAGLLAIVVSRQPLLILFAFRLEANREITWGGDINQPVLRNEQTGALSPRRSFAQFKETIVGRAAPWTEEDLASAQIVLSTLRRQASEPHQISALIESGFDSIRHVATDENLLDNSLLDAIGNGVSLLFRSASGEPVVRYANQSLLDLADSLPEPLAKCSEAGAAGSSVADLLSAVGLQPDLLSKTELQPVEVVIASAAEGFRNFLVEKKLALEIAEQTGTVSLSALVFTDTTRSERAREAFKAAQEKAKHLTMLKSSFLANMSHEIRTPMNGILGMVQLLQLTRTDPEQRDYLNVIQESGEALLVIVNDILDIAKIEAGHIQLENLRFDLAAVVEGVVNVMRPRALEKSIGLSAVFEGPPPYWFEGDALRLRQILLNLVGNAVKFTAKGQVLVRVRCDERPRQPSLAAISVVDTGIGIEPDQLGSIFEKFHQADPSTTRAYGGTGLGLAISRELTNLMGGTISLSSTVGAGSTFTVSVPLQRTSSHSPATAPVAPPAMEIPAAGRRILVVEDDPNSQAVIAAMLRKRGFEVLMADSGVAALDAFQSHAIDLILMDCQIPKLDGYETTARIRGMEGPQRRTPIIALTANALPDDRQRCLDAGMDDYLPKPVSMQAVFEALAKWPSLKLPTT